MNGLPLPETEPITPGYFNVTNATSPLPEFISSTIVPLVEPRPKWEAAKAEWGVIWPLHWMGLSALFFLQSFIMLVIFIRIALLGRRRGRRNSALGKFTTTVCVVLLVFAFTRALYLLIDPYESQQCLFGKQTYCPLWLNRVLFSLALPGLTVAFLLFHFAFLEVTKMRGLSAGRLQNTCFLVGLSAFNYLLAVASDVIVAYINIKQILIPCQVYFIALGLVLSGAFIYSGSKIVHSSRSNWSEINKVKMDTAKRLSVADLHETTPKYKVSPQLYKTLCLTAITVVIWIIYVVFQLTYLILMYVGALSNWWWITLETSYRLCEFFLATAVYLAATGQRTSRPRANSAMTTNYKSNSNVGKDTAVIMNAHTPVPER